MKKNMVVIGIPIYKATLNQYEIISLQQVARILGRYPIRFIAPNSLIFDYGSDYENWGIERFPDMFFKNTDSYSQLLMSESFYQRFHEYEYLLIYQLDAFVFLDRLEEFCLKGFDYIGAPLPRMVPAWGKLNICVGNGGLSLRNIAKSLLCVRLKMKISEEAHIYEKLLKTEDLFFSYCGISCMVEFNIPSRQVAEKFSVDFNVRNSYFRVMQSLPFCCHGWYLRNYDFWKPIIERFGYEVPKIEQAKFSMDSNSIRHRFACRYLVLRMLRFSNRVKLKKVIEQVFPKVNEWSVWGYGDDGERCCSLLTLAGIRITVVYDQKFVVPKVENGIVYTYPDFVEIKSKKVAILVATSKYEDTIMEELKHMGYQKEKKVYSYGYFERKILDNYYNRK